MIKDKFDKDLDTYRIDTVSNQYVLSWSKLKRGTEPNVMYRTTGICLLKPMNVALYLMAVNDT